MKHEFLTIDDADFNNKTVILRVDLNCPIDPETHKFLDIRRLIKHAETIKELVDKGAKVVLLAHQGRPGDEYEFTTMTPHAKELSQILGVEVTRIADIIGPYAQEKIKQLKKGDILLLENVRFLSEELLNRPADVQSLTHFVKNLAPHADYFVNDAFAAAHRSQPSIVGFTEVLPSFAGRVMQQEVESLTKAVKSPKRPAIFLVGGSKIRTSVKAIDQFLAQGAADKILTSGVVANVFLVAKGYEVRGLEYIERFNEHVNNAKRLLRDYEDHIEIPLDLAMDKYGKRFEVSLAELPLPYRIADIGQGTIDHYTKILSSAGTIVANGPAGMIEQKEFARGTHELVRAIAESNAYSVIGGGHIATAVSNLHLEDKISHLSTGGGACLSFLSGDSLPAFEALQKAFERDGKTVKQTKLTGGKK